jgi:malonate transporter and related proteins
MAEVLGALAPVFILIAVGWTARAARIASAEAFGMVNRLGYFILYPAFLFTLISRANYSDRGAGPFALGVTLAFAAMIGLALSTRFFLRGDGPAFTSVFQGSSRWNGFALLAAAPKLYGPSGVELIGLAFGPLVLLVNIACVVVLSRWGAARAPSVRAVLDQIVANPLILACAAGLIANAAGMHGLGPLAGALNLLGGAAMPIALLCVGAGLDFKALRASGAHVAVACVLKLVVMPAMVWAGARLCGADPLTAAVAAGIGSTPTAAAGYTLAREMGGDARLMAAIITATTIGSAITMPIAIALATPR